MRAIRRSRVAAVVLPLTLALALGGLNPADGVAATTTGSGAATHVVVLEDGASADQVLRRLGASVAISHRYDRVLNGFAADLDDATRARLEADPDVASVTANRNFLTATVEPQAIVPAYPQKPTASLVRVGGLKSPTAKIDGRGGKVDADIAIIDSGVDRDHPDLYVAGGVNCRGGSRQAWDDESGHGTFVAGGAIASVGPVELTNSTVKNSEATAVSASVAVGLAGGIGALDSVELKSSTIKGNKATSGAATAAVSLAGGIGLLDLAGGDGELTMDKSTVSKNTAAVRGNGAVAIAAAGGIGLGPTAPDRAHEIARSTVDGNKATASGSLVSVAVAGGILNLNEIDPGDADVNGLHVDDTEAPAFYDIDVPAGSQTKITNNKATCDAGFCIATGGGYANTVLGLGSGDATFENTLFKGNVADGDDGVGLGGGLFLVEGSTDLDGVKVIKNKALGDLWAKGGGLWTLEANDVDIDPTSVFDDNEPDDCFAADPNGGLFCGDDD